MKNIYNIDPDDVWWSASDIGWIVGHSYIVYAPLFKGCTTILFEGKPVGTPDAGVFWKIISDYKVKSLFTAPTAFRAIKKEDPEGKLFSKYDLSTFESLFLAGERADPNTIKWAESLLKVPVIDHWWQTESGWPMLANMVGVELQEVKPGSASFPVCGYDIEILDDQGNVDFEDTTITQNTRVSYPLYHIDNIVEKSIGKNPKNIFFLTADAFGVLPPISKLTPSQAAYHFISGYTAKVAGTEAGVDEPLPSFSACFGAPFMPLHPTKYAEMLSKKMQEAGVNVWLVNTGWTGGSYGIGRRMPLKYTRAMITAVLEGKLGDYTYEDYHIHSVFGVAQPRTCPGVPTELLSPRATWNNDKAYYDTAFKLSNAFRENFKKFSRSLANEEIRRGGPQR